MIFMMTTLYTTTHTSETASLNRLSPYVTLSLRNSLSLLRNTPTNAMT